MSDACKCWFWPRCHFEPRYDIGAPSMSLEGKSTPSGFAEMVEATKPKTYVHDICVSCGKVVNRSTGDSGE